MRQLLLCLSVCAATPVLAQDDPPLLVATAEDIPDAWRAPIVLGLELRPRPAFREHLRAAARGEGHLLRDGPIDAM